MPAERPLPRETDHVDSDHLATIATAASHLEVGARTPADWGTGHPSWTLIAEPPAQDLELMAQREDLNVLLTIGHAPEP